MDSLHRPTYQPFIGFSGRQEIFAEKLVPVGKEDKAFFRFLTAGKRYDTYVRIIGTGERFVFLLAGAIGFFCNIHLADDFRKIFMLAFHFRLAVFHFHAGSRGKERA